MRTTSNIPDKTPRKLFLGPFQPALESALASEIAAHKKACGPLAPLHIVVPARLLGLHLRRTLASELGGHCNLRVGTLRDLASEIDPSRFAPSIRLAPRFGLELLCARIARDVVPGNGYFSPVRDTKGFAAALLNTFTDLKEAAIAPDAFRRVAKVKKLQELSAAYAEFCRWLEERGLRTEADLFQGSPGPDLQSPVLLYGFYDLNTVQKQFIQKIQPSAVFFPWSEHGAYARPLLDWFQSLGFEIVSSPRSTLHAARSSVLSCPGEAAEVREAARAAFAYLREHPEKTFNEVAILCRSREQYDALFRDTLRHLGIPAYFRGGRPIGEHTDAKRLRLLLETIRSDFSCSAVMELAGHLGIPRTGTRSRWNSASSAANSNGARVARQTRRLGSLSNRCSPPATPCR